MLFYYFNVLGFTKLSRFYGLLRLRGYSIRLWGYLIWLRGYSIRLRDT